MKGVSKEAELLYSLGYRDWKIDELHPQLAYLGENKLAEIKEELWELSCKYWSVTTYGENGADLYTVDYNYHERQKDQREGIKQAFLAKPGVTSCTVKLLRD